MNKGLAHILKNKIAGTPFIDKLAGLVYTAEYQETVEDENDVPTTYIKKVPVSCDIDPGDCDKNDLVPDSSKKGILYFEDRGIAPNGTDQRGMYKFKSAIRLVAWINTEWIKNDSCVDTAGILMTYCIDRIMQLNLQNVGNYVRLQIVVANIPKQDKLIFSEYSYDQYVGITMPPYEFFAIDFSIEFQVHPSCMDQINMRTTDEYHQAKDCITEPVSS